MLAQGAGGCLLVNVSKQALVDSFTQAWGQVIMLAPKLVAMVSVLVIGYVLARWVAGIITVVSEKIGLQTAAEKSGLAKSMHDVGIRRPLPSIVGGLVFWLLMCVFVMAAFNILGLQSISDAMGEVVNYIPRLLVATVVVVIGLLAATFLRGVVATSADRVGLTYAEYLAGGCYWVLDPHVHRCLQPARHPVCPAREADPDRVGWPLGRLRTGLRPRRPRRDERHPLGLLRPPATAGRRHGDRGHASRHGSRGGPGGDSDRNP